MTSCLPTPSRFEIDLDLIVAQIALVERGNPALGLAQIEEQLLLARGRAHLHQRPRAQDVFLDRGANPPHGVGRELEALVRLEALDRLHEADVALGNHFADRQAVAAIAHGDLGHQAQMRGDELVRRLAVPMLAPALGEHVFLLRLQHREPLDLLQVAGKPGFTRNDGKRRGHVFLGWRARSRPSPSALKAGWTYCGRASVAEKGPRLDSLFAANMKLFHAALRPRRASGCPRSS